MGAARSQRGTDPPVVVPPRKLLDGVLTPETGTPSPPRLLDKAADVRDDRVALGSPLDDAVLHVDDEECGVRPVLECGHGLPLLTLGSCVPRTIDIPTDRWAGTNLGPPPSNDAGNGFGQVFANDPPGSLPRLNAQIIFHLHLT